MKITRDVIYDLLPSYFAGEASDDTRALVEEYFTTDPEFGRMAERFRTLLDDDRHAGTVDTVAGREKASFDRARARAERPQHVRAAALLWGMGSLISFGIALITGLDRFGWKHPGIIIGTTFGAFAVAVWISSYYTDADSWWARAWEMNDDGEWRRHASRIHKRRKSA